MKLADSLALAIDTNNGQMLKTLVADASSYAHLNGSLGDCSVIGDDEFQLIKNTIETRRIVGIENGDQLLLFLMSEWQGLTLEQRTSLIDPLSAAFPVMDDRMCIFLTAEILGRYVANDLALTALSEMSKTRSASHAEAVAYAVGQLGTRRPVLASKCLELLETIRADWRMTSVVDEVDGALSKLSKVGEYEGENAKGGSLNSDG